MLGTINVGVEVVTYEGLTPEQRLVWAILETFIKDYHESCTSMRIDIEKRGRVSDEHKDRHQRLKYQTRSEWVYDLCAWVGYHGDNLAKVLRRIEESYEIPLHDLATPPEYSPRPLKR